jgi:hypothetical protein
MPDTKSRGFEVEEDPPVICFLNKDRFSKEFKLEALRLLKESGKPEADVCPGKRGKKKSLKFSGRPLSQALIRLKYEECPSFFSCLHFGLEDVLCPAILE